MNNKRATKRALLTSVTALVMCVVMLVGTTFAWFTDTASTGVNKIQAGNLKVDIVNKDGTSLKNESLSFIKAGPTADTGATTEILWEPGCRYLTEGFKIKNAGNLALKWKAEINKEDAKTEVVAGSNGKRNMNLLDVIDFYIVKGTEENAPAVAIENFTGTLSAEATSDLYYIKGVMKTTAGNDYQDLTLDGISITVYATQLTAEFDSFDNQYDKDAKYTEVIAAGKEFRGKATLSTGITATNPNAIAVKAIGADADVTILDGTFDGGKGGNNQCVHVRDGATVTIKGGTFTVGADAAGAGNSVIESFDGNIVIEGGFFQTDYNWNGFYYVLNQNNNNPGTITVKGGTFVNYDPSKGDDNLGGNFVAEGYDVITETKANGDVWYTVVKGTGATVGTQEGLNNAISSNTVATVKLTEDGTYNLTDGIAKSKDVTFIGTKDTVIDVCQNLDGESGVNAGMNYQDGATLVFKGVTILGQVSGNYGGIVRAATTFEDCTIKGKLTLYGDTTFINCTFENQNDYSIWTWGAKNVTFEGCTFMTGGKAINLYGGADYPGAPTTVLTVNNCIFNDSNNGATGKAAIEVGNDYGATYILTVNNVTVNGFAVNTEGEDTGSRIWANKKSMDAAHLTVTIDGVKVH